MRVLCLIKIRFGLVMVGSTLANINGLESGGRWNFKAVSFTKGTSYKLSKLSGL